MTDERPLARVFGVAADAYQRGRPEYPKAVYEWLLPSADMRVVEVGAGTGKFTRGLVRRGIEVIATEPDPGMRAVLHRALPSVEILDGSAEAIPLERGSVNAVLAASCWHWVDQARASAEAARVLAPGGVLGVIWNDMDDTDPWVAELSALFLAFEPEQRIVTEAVQHPPFGPFEQHAVRWEDDTTVDGVVDRIASISYVIALADDRRAEVLARVRQHAQERLASNGVLSVPYVTRACRAFVET